MPLLGFQNKNLAKGRNQNDFEIINTSQEVPPPPKKKGIPDNFLDSLHSESLNGPWKIAIQRTKK